MANGEGLAPAWTTEKLGSEPSIGNCLGCETALDDGDGPYCDECEPRFFTRG